MSYEEHMQKINETIASYHKKRRGEDGLTFEEAVAMIVRMGYSEGEAQRWLRAIPSKA